jgi:hypothetical protein
VYVDVDGSRAGESSVSEDSLQPDAARTSAQPSAASSRTAQLPDRSAQGRNLRFTIIDGTPATDLDESRKHLREDAALTEIRE